MAGGTRTGWKSAIVDGLAVLLGILVAFAIDAAWETRQERARLDAYLVSLADELDANRGALEADLERRRAHIDRLEGYIVQLGTPGAAVSQEALRIMAGDLAPLRQRPMQRAAFDDLVAGGLQLIDDGRIRRLILEYGRTMEADAVRQRIAEEWFDRRANPYDELNHDLVGMRSAAYGETWAGRDDLRFEIDPGAFVGNRRYANLLAARFYRSTSLVAARGQLLAILTELEQVLPAEGRAAE